MVAYMKNNTMRDITILFLTINRVPKKWAEYQLDVLKKAIGDADVISVSKEPMDFGVNLIQAEEPSTANIYWQILRAAKIATTPYVAIAEDDVLYCYEHFNFYRPPIDTFAYNMVRWQIHMFDTPMYYWRKRLANYALIAPRELLIEALEERFAKYPFPDPRGGMGEVGKTRMEKRLGLIPRKVIEFSTTTGIVCLHHEFGIDPLEKNGRKRRGMIRAYSIPYWGQAKNIMEKFI
jgi:hypothetical protein